MDILFDQFCSKSKRKLFYFILQNDAHNLYLNWPQFIKLFTHKQLWTLIIDWISCGMYLNNWPFLLCTVICFVVQDYHVILIYEGEAATLVYDFDTVLPFPCSFDTYVKESLPEDDLLKPEFQRYRMCRN